METMKCPKCRKKRHPTKDFAWRSKAKKRRQSWCVLCQREARKLHYRSNQAQYRARNVARREGNQRLYQKYLLDHPCVDCGENNPIVLEPDHVRGKKAFNISRMIRESSWNAVLTELSKCDIRCSNCHKLKTAVEQGWTKVAAWAQLVLNMPQPEATRLDAKQIVLAHHRSHDAVRQATEDGDASRIKRMLRQFNFIGAILRRKHAA